jgi:hypothetical protein
MLYSLSVQKEVLLQGCFREGFFILYFEIESWERRTYIERREMYLPRVEKVL